MDTNTELFNDHKVTFHAVFKQNVCIFMAYSKLRPLHY